MLSAPLLPRKLRSLLLTGAVAVTSPLLFTRPAHADQWALLIGIDQYDDVNHINPLGGASADARALAKTLHESASFPEEHIKVLVSDGDLKPTRTNILNALAHLADNAKPGDTVFVLYSGHGVEIDGTPYLLPYDTSAYNDSTITDSALETAKFRAHLKQVKAKALILAFDMCRSDPRKTGKDVTAADNKLTHSLARGLDFKQAPTDNGTAASSPIAVTLYSCTEGERSYEWQDKGRGYFSYYLEQGLKGAAADPTGQVTIGSLATYVETHVKTEVEQDEHHEQTPYPSLDGPSASDFVLAHTSLAAPVITPTVKIVDTHAHLQVTVNAPNPTITIDGQPLTPGTDYVANLLDEDKKTVHVKVTAPQYDGQVLDVELHKGITSPLTVTLAALPPLPVAPMTPVTTAVVNAERPIHISAKLGTLTGHSNGLNAASFSPDGRYIVTGSWDHTAIVWDAQTGEKVRTLKGHREEVEAASFSPDGRYILTGSYDKTAIVWDAQTGKKMRTLAGHNSTIWSASFSPDGRDIVTGTGDGTAIVWDAQTGEEVRRLKGHHNTVWAASFSPDGRYILTGSEDHTAIVWDAQTGEKVRTLAHSHAIAAASFSPDGRYIVTGSKDTAVIVFGQEDTSAIVWDAQTGEKIRTLTGHGGEITAASFSPDDHYIVTGSEDHTAIVWDAQTGEKLRTLAGHSNSVKAASFSPDGRYIVTGSQDHTAIVWDAATGKSSE